FTAIPCLFCPNTDGGNPYGGFILSGNTLYGTAACGGSSENSNVLAVGTVFAVHTDGTGVTNLHSFTYGDGANPVTGLILSCNTLIGMTVKGGSWEYGTIFAVNTDGLGFTNLRSFCGSDGAYPLADLILSGNTLYGAADQGGSGAGTVFRVNTDGTDFANLYSFTALSDPYYTNSDGAFPEAGLILSGNTLYGTAY